GSVTFTVTGGALPTGMNLSGGGVLSGTPTVPGPATFTVTVTDANGCTGVRIYTLMVGCRPITITPGTLPRAAEFTAYQATLSTTGAHLPVTFTLASGSLPNGLSLSAAGVIDGGPDGRGSFTFGVHVTDADSCGTTATFTIPVSRQVLMVTGPGAGVPQVRGFDVNGALLGTVLTDPPSFTGGVRVAVGDVNGDGVTDVILARGPGTPAFVRVVDGASQTILLAFNPFDPSFTGGVYVAAGDVNGDGFADVITGAGPGGGPHVQVFDLHDGATLASFYAYAAGFTGGVRVAAGDINGDGHADVLTAPGAGGGPHVRVWSGATGGELLGWFAYDPAFGGGVFVATPVTVNRMSVDVPAANATVNGSFF